MNTLKPVIMMLTFTIASFGLGPIQAQPVQPTPKKVAVHPRALITQVEIAEYRRAIGGASTRAAKQAIRETTYARLRQRAAERGMVMVEPHPWYGGLHWGEMGYQTSAPLTTKTPEPTPAPVAKQVAPATVTKPQVTPSTAPVAAHVVAKSVPVPHASPAASHSPAKPAALPHIGPATAPRSPAKPALPPRLP